jgi:hypothetical protein
MRAVAYPRFLPQSQILHESLGADGDRYIPHLVEAAISLRACTIQHHAPFSRATPR